MTAPATLTHLFAELASLEDLGIPLKKGSARLRYTCLCVSQRYICLGSNTGGVYVFSRDSLKHLQIVFGDVETSPVTTVAVSPNDLYLALAVSSGQVVVMELNIERRTRPERIRQTVDHLGAIVTTMVWDSSGSCLFVGDTQGKVTQVNVPTSKAKIIFTQPSQTVVRLESSVYQLDWWGGKLLVSTHTRTYLLNTAKQQFSQIGKKLREGEFGSCFFLEPSSNYPVVYCARPGSRMWEVDFEGNVLNTHQFKQLLATRPLPVVTPGVDLDAAVQVPFSGAQSVNFQKMFRIGEFILSWSGRGLYVFDPINVKVVLWTDGLAGIKDVCLLKNKVYVFLDSQLVRRLVFLPLFQLCSSLVTRQRCLLAAKLLLYMEHFSLRPTLMKRVKRDLVALLLDFLTAESHFDVAEKVRAMLEDVSEGSLDSVDSMEDADDRSVYQQYMTQQTSGIVVVNDGSGSVFDFENLSRSHRTSPSLPFKLVEPSAVAKNGVLERCTSQTSSADLQQALQDSHMLSSSRTHSHESSGELDQVSGSCSASSSIQLTDDAKRNLNVVVGDVGEQVHRLEDTVMNSTHSSGNNFSASSRESTREVAKDENENFDMAEVIGADLTVEGMPDSTHLETKYSKDKSGVNMTDEIDGPSQTVLSEDMSSEADANSGECTLTVDRVSGIASLPGTDKAEAKLTGEEECVRRTSSMPHLMDDAGTEVTDEGRPSVPADMGKSTSEGTRKDSSGYDVGLVTRVTKKKKKRHVNIVDIPIAGTSSGELKRSYSTGTLKQRKKKELRHGRSLDSSPVRDQEDELYCRTDADPDTISIATISSIEEENTVDYESSPVTSVTPTPTDDVFPSGSAHFNNVTDTESGHDRFLSSASEPGEMKLSVNAGVQEHGVKFKSGIVSLELFEASEAASREQLGGFVRVGSPEHPEKSASFTVGSPRSASSPLPADVHLDAAHAGTDDIVDGEVPSGEGGMEDEHHLSINAVRFITSSDHSEYVSQSDNISRNAKLILSLSDSNLAASFECTRSRSTDPEREIIPPLLQRLSAMGVSPTVGGMEEWSMYSQDLPSMRNRFTDASRRSISSVKDRVTKLGSSTRSLIQRVKEKNPLASKSPSNSPPTAMVVGYLSPQANHDIGSAIYPSATQSKLSSSDKAQESSSVTVNVDLKPLLTKTEETQKELSTPSVLMNQQKLKSVLNAWASELNKTLFAMHQEMNAEKKKRKLSELAQEKEDRITREDAQHLTQKESAVDGDVTKESQEADNKSVISDIWDSGCADMGSPVDTVAELVLDPDRKEQLDEDSERERKRSASADSYLNKHSDDSLSVSEKTAKGKRSLSVVCNGHVSGGSDVKLTGLLEGNHKFTSSESDDVTTETLVDDADITIETDWVRVCHVQDPFHLTPQQHISVSTIATYCLECSCFGDAHSIFHAVPSGPKTISKSQSSTRPAADFTSSGYEAYPSVQLQDGKVLHKLFPSPGPDLVQGHHNGHDSKKKRLSSHSQLVPSGSTYLDGLVETPTDAVQDKSSDTKASDPNKNNGIGPGCGSNVDGKEHVDTKDVHLDEERALYVRLFYHLLPHWRIRRLMAEEREPVFKTWCALVACCQVLGTGDIVWMKIDSKDVTGSLDYLRSGILPNKAAFLGHVASLFALSPLRVADFAAEVPRQITLRDVLHLCRLHGKSQQQVLTRYLTQRLGTMPSHMRAEVVKQLASTTEGKVAVLQCLLSLPSPQPAPRTTSESSRHVTGGESSKLAPEVISEVLGLLLSLVKDGEVAQILSVCWKHSYWPGYLRLLTQTHQWERALQVAVELDNFSLLDGTAQYGFTPRSLTEWKHLMNLYKDAASKRSPDHPNTQLFDTLNPPAFSLAGDRLDLNSHPATQLQSSDMSRMSASGEKSDSAREDVSGGPVSADGNIREGEKGAKQLTWMSLGLLAAQHLGAGTAVELLQQCCGAGVGGDDDPAPVGCGSGGGGGDFNQEFYRTCITLSALEQQQRLVIHNMLEKVDSYLWAKKPVHVSPQVHYAVTREKAALQSRNTRDDSYQNLFARLSSAPIPAGQLAEDPDCHWGVNTSIVSVCAVCQVSVSETVSHTEPGAYVFKCGHAFHKCCAPDKLCPQC